MHYVGSEQQVLNDGIAALRRRIPGLQLTGQSGFFDKTPGSVDNERVLDNIRSSGARVLLVGMGMPVQEAWINAVSGELDVPVIWACGAAIEYYSGHVKLAPRWINAIGMEWAYRLAHRPTRLAHRYLVEPLYLLPTVLTDLSRRFGGAT